MDKKDEYWQIFAHTGRVEDYLRYAQAVRDAAEVKETRDGTDGEGTDRPRTQYR